MSSENKPIDLPEISLAHVEFVEESWDYGNNLGIGVSIPEQTAEPLIRWAVSYSKHKMTKRPVYDEREVVFEVGDGSGRTVTQTVFVLIERGESVPLTPEELEAARSRAKGELIWRLRHMLAACQYLVPGAEGMTGPDAVEVMRRVEQRKAEIRDRKPGANSNTHAREAQAQDREVQP